MVLTHFKSTFNHYIIKAADIIRVILSEAIPLLIKILTDYISSTPGINSKPRRIPWRCKCVSDKIDLLMSMSTEFGTCADKQSSQIMSQYLTKAITVFCVILSTKEDVFVLYSITLYKHLKHQMSKSIYNSNKIIIIWVIKVKN